jgi:2-keto-4-pentenoate hydratase
VSVSKQAAIELLDRRKAGANEPVLSDSLRPKSIDDALAIQAQMLTLQPVKGWKCLLPPDPEKVVVAPVFKVQNNSPTLALFECENVAMVEPEIAFVLDRDLPARAGEYSEQEIVNAIGSAHMALECIQKRFSKEAYEHFYDALADGLYNQGIYIGPEINKTQAINASAVKIFIEQSSHTLALEGVHPNPRAIDGLLWLINFMNKRGVGLKANEAIITGSFKGIVELAFDEVTTIEYENLGKYHVKFTRAQ